MRMLISFAVLALCACSGAESPSQPAAAAAQAPAAQAPAGEEPVNPAFIGRVWRSTNRTDPLGSILVFLPDRTLLIDSCFETYRISEWGVVGNRIRWREDSIPLEAEVITPSKDELILREPGQNRERRYIAITDPYTCPDMPR